jgi:predicted RNase H-like HicB family nuclease
MRHSITILIEQGEDGKYIATAPALKSCYTQADSIPQVLEKIKEVIELCLEVEADILPLPKFIGIQQIEYNEKF